MHGDDSGLVLPPVSLGLWQNFGEDRPLSGARAILRRAVDLGVTHVDLANNYGPPYGSAERNFGAILARDFRPYRDDYRPVPFSKDYVRHIEGWYAQKHPDEDFAETFAVWLTPRSGWRRKYAGWPALKKLRYVERSAISFDGDALSRMSREEATRLEALPMRVSEDGAVVVALAEPTDARFLALHELLGDRIDCVVVAKSAIDAGLRSDLLPKDGSSAAAVQPARAAHTWSRSTTAAPYRGLR